VASITNGLAPCFVLPEWTGVTLSDSLLVQCVSAPLTKHRVKEQLRSGTVLVSGDQWPIFLFQGYRYDVEDPWNGLLQSSLLISVRLAGLLWIHRSGPNFLTLSFRHSSTFLHPLAQSRKNPKQLAREMLASMECSA
jgi:hypothetical protein